jgi:hypothetical protein
MTVEWFCRLCRSVLGLTGPGAETPIVGIHLTAVGLIVVIEEEGERYE